MLRHCAWPPCLQDSISWAIGFAVPAAAMALAIIIFIAGSSLYTHVEPTERHAFCQSPVSTLHLGVYASPAALACACRKTCVAIAQPDHVDCSMQQHS